MADPAPVIVVTHPSCVAHDTGFGHPERPERLTVIMEMLDADLPDIEIVEGPAASDTQLMYAHPRDYIDDLMGKAPKDDGLVHIDPDTVLSAGSLEAARHAAGCACLGTELVMTGKAGAVFCAIRPPGHHAELDKAMGFCLFNNAYIAARHAQEKHGAKRVAIVDFDVHHGNGTADMIYQHKRDDIFYTSSHQFPLFPGTGDPQVDDDAGGLILDVPLPAGTGSEAFRAAWTDDILPRLKEFTPDLIIISAGFDAHKDDPVGGMHLDEGDFEWVTAQIKAVQPRIVSVLEGGYDLNALANSVRAHLVALST